MNKSVPPPPAPASLKDASSGSSVPLPPPPQLPIKYSAASTGGQWLTVARSEDASAIDTGGTAEQESRRRVKQALSAVLGSEQLVVLVGLGPSAGVGGPRMSDLWRKVRDKDLAKFKSIQQKVGDATPDTDSGDIEALLSKCQLLASIPVKKDSEVSSFISDAEAIIGTACRDFLELASLSDHEHLLRIIARRPHGKPRARIFTTNYDLCIERAASNAGVLIVDGFGRESPPAFDGLNFDIDFVRRRIESKGPEFIDGVIHLAKLHGSVDWAAEGNRIVRREKPEDPVLIYPRSDKFELSYRQPFLELISQFQTALRQPNIGLLVLGFGFADDHLSEMILSAVKRNLSMRVVAATFGCESHCADISHGMYRPKLHLLHRLLGQGDSRITLIDSTFSDLVRILPDLGTETEEAKLRAVLKRLLA